MMKTFTHYDEVADWTIIDRKTIHAYDTNETPIEIVEVQVGNLEVVEIEINNRYNAHLLPITRWITAHELERLTEDTGYIVW